MANDKQSYYNVTADKLNNKVPRNQDNIIGLNGFIFIFSAKTKWSMMKYLEKMHTFLGKRANVAIGDLAYSLQRINNNLEQRVAIFSYSIQDLKEKIEKTFNLKESRGNSDLDIYLSWELRNNLMNSENSSNIHEAIDKGDIKYLGKCWAAGEDIDFRQIYNKSRFSFIDIPSYSFEHKFKFNPDIYSSQISNNTNVDYSTNSEIYVYNEPYLKDHTINDEQVLIGVTHGSLALNAFFDIFPEENSAHIHRLTFMKPIEVKENQSVKVLVEPIESEEKFDFKVKYCYDSSNLWDVTAIGSLKKVLWEGKKIYIEELKEAFEEIKLQELKIVENPIVKEGDSYRLITNLYRSKRQVLAKVRLTQISLTEKHSYVLHPLISYSAFQAVAFLLEQEGFKDGALPFGINDIYFRRTNSLVECWLLVTLVKNSEEMIIFDVDVINDSSEIVASFYGCSMKKIHFIEQDISKETMEFENRENINTMNIKKDLYKKIQKYIVDKLEGIIKDSRKLTNFETNLMDLGIESKQLILMTNEIEKDTQIELYPTLFFEYPNIKELTEFFLNEHSNSFKILFENDSTKDTDFVEKREVLDSSFQKSRESSSGIRGIQESQVINSKISTDKNENDIAIIGIQGQFAEASNLDEFWESISKNEDLIREIPIDHWDYRPWFDENLEAKNKTYCKWGSFINGVDKFDAKFFNISPREAEGMDPQLRLMLQSIYASAEDAGYISQVRGSNTGIFIGVCNYDYLRKITEMNLEPDPQVALNNSVTGFANRISFLFDFKGPSNTIDTACSSSLTSLHYACNAIRNKECDMAFVGGANLLLSSSHYRYFSSIRAFSPTGRCHTFDEAADGYVPGECIGSILLKPLKQAIKDGDHIYAVIKGTAALHGGYTSSFTAPSVEGEENVIIKAWEDAGINPETLSYIEAHGTGTKLGDPVEINSLKKAFKKYTNKEQFCAIGSVKSNIGHTEGAAGIASILKVILQMKHRMIPSLYGFQRLNPYIKLDKSPMYINTEIKKWESLEGVPRRAGINSFGISGSYAHVVLEEYIPNEQEQLTYDELKERTAIILLSAKNEECLKERAKQLLIAISEKRLNIEDIAYTLQVGRDALEERLGFIVNSTAELKERLQDFIEHGGNDINSYRGRIKQNKDKLDVFEMNDEMEKTIEVWLDKEEYSELLKLWVEGFDYDWNKLYGEIKPHRISLPVYPFAKESYWVSMKDTQTNNTSVNMDHRYEILQGVIHPLLHYNNSNLFEQRFSTNFTGNEFFFRDHVIKGYRVLPGVAYLEMVREAITQSIEDLEKEKLQIRLKNIAWIRPIAVKENRSDTNCIPIKLRLRAETESQINYEIYSLHGTNDEETIVHSQGLVSIEERVDEIPNLNIKALLEECDQGSYSATQWYSAIGTVYGPSFQGVQMIYKGKAHLLAKLSLPASVEDNWDKFILHPSLMDSAVQVALISSIINSGEQALPFALEDLEILSQCSKTMWALVRDSEGGKAGDKVRKFDIDLCNEQGTVCVRMKGLSSRVQEGEIGEIHSIVKSKTLFFEPVWVQKEVTSENKELQLDQHLVVFCEPDRISEKEIEARIKDKVSCFVLCSDKHKIEERFQAYTIWLFEKIKSIIEDKPRGNILIQVVVSNQGEKQLFSGLSGLMKTACLENTKIISELIEIDFKESVDLIVQKLIDNSQKCDDIHIRYEHDKRLVQEWNEIDASTKEISIPWKDNSVYLIIGGSGKLGLIFAREIILKAKNITLILTGKSKFDDSKLADLKQLEILGAKIVYKQVDVTKREEVDTLLKDISEQYGSIKGIIHSAGVIKDNFIIKKTTQELQKVLLPKICGIVNVDEASKNIPLDFLIVFSSVTGSLGNIGQADYAVANAFMDAYVKYRNTLMVLGRRQGRTLSINWPLWREGGMHVDSAVEEMLQSSGLNTMSTRSGLQAFYKLLTFNKPQVMVMEGSPKKIRENLLQVSNNTDVKIENSIENVSTISEVDTESLLNKVQANLIQLTGQFLKSKDVEIDTEFNEYGFDSITLIQFTNVLNEKYKLHLTPTVFFENTNLKSLAIFLISHYQKEISQIFMGEVKSLKVKEFKENELVNKVPISKSVLGKKIKESILPNTGLMKSEPIAIIGMSGVFPKACNIEEFWKRLESGEDCITEVPESRWDWRKYYGDPLKEINKTNIKWGGFIDGIDEFDPLFFGISPKEAEFMDPQQRLLMMHVWKAIEDAGYSAQSLSGTKTAIFVGTSSSGYSSLISNAGIPIEANTLTGMVPSVGPNRMSYFLNIHGPSEPIETACSSSLIAIHRAVESIRNGDCEMAIVGGVNTIVTPEAHISFSKAGMLSVDGRCKTFSSEANGYSRGEGAGMIFLKKLKDAEQDGDHIYGVIRGTAENHGGRTNSLTAPNLKAQAELLKTAYRNAGIDARTITYIEVHGTGTKLGDPIEVESLKSAFGDLYKENNESEIIKQRCGLGSVKTNIGHLELAAGISGVIKVLLQLKHKTLVKSLHCESISPYIQLNDTPFYIVKDKMEWTELKDDYGRTIPRRAGVSSFGFGGANAHIILEEYIPKTRENNLSATNFGNHFSIILSAKNKDRLKEQAKQFLETILKRNFSDDDLVDIAYTLQVGRDAMEERLGFMVSSIEEVREKLQAFVEGQNDIADFYYGKAKCNKDILGTFTSDEDLKSVIEEWIRKRKYLKLLDLWVKGLNFDWNNLYEGMEVKRISLPTYPFSRESYWISGEKDKSEVVSDVSYDNDRKIIDFKESEIMTFEEVWQEQKLLFSSTTKTRTIVCFLSSIENQRVFSSKLQILDEQNGEHTKIIFIAQSNDFKKNSDKEYTISRKDYSCLVQAFRSICKDYGEIDTILYLWAIEDSSCISDYSCIVNIIQSMEKEKLKAKQLLLVGTYNNYLERCYLESWIGFERSLRLSLPYTKIATVYEEMHKGNVKTEINNWAKILWEEMRNDEIESAMYINGKRHISRVKPLSIQKENSILKSGSTYLITGGCGGLGNLFAQYLAKQHVNLILTGRSTINEEITMKIKRLEALGSKVLYLKTDVSDLVAMNEGLSLARERFGKINGVIHAAGVTGTESIFEKKIEDFEDIINPKVKGTIVLDEVLKNDILDFICYFSSSSAILGDFGACDYAVANRFQTAYAQYQCNGQQQGKSIAINWPLWREGGIVVGDPNNTYMYLKSSGQRYLETAEGIDLFERIISQNHSQCLVTVGEINRIHQFLGLNQKPVSSISKQINTCGKGWRAEMKGMSLEQCLEWDIKEQISKQLKISRDELDREENLADFGFDSIGLAQFSSILSNYYEIEITPTVFYGYSTIEKLTQYFLSNYSELIQDFYKDDNVIQTTIGTTAFKEEVMKSENEKSENIALEERISYEGINDPIAIIGMSGRFPGARNIEEMWSILESGKDMVLEIPKERFESERHYKNLDNKFKNNTYKRCGIIPGVSEFDPLFFEMSPKEAELTDPRQRLLLEESWKALEDAGYGSEQIKNSKIGMFVGAEDGDYQLLTKGKGSITSNHTGILASRLAYFLNLNGPVLSINTACSSGLVAAHQAILSLDSKECDTAIAAGVNLILTKEKINALSEAGMLSEDGKCFAFDKRANGMVPGEAVVAVVLKRLSKAKADGDPIYAVIRGSGINYDGKTNGITAPSGVSQTNLLKEIYDKYKINPEEIEYVVAHGTGTKLGDPIEVNALNDAFKAYTKKQDFCAITSTKTNFGHTFAASGLVNLVGLVQGMRHKTIPATLHCEEVNEYINWKESPFYINRSNRNWIEREGKRLMGAISCFGMSGTNAHMVVESYSSNESNLPQASLPFYILAFSAKSQEALQEKINDMYEIMKESKWDSAELTRVSYTLLEGRQHFNYRCAIVVQDCEDALYVMKQMEGNEKLINLFEGKVSRDFIGQKAIKKYAFELLNRSQLLKNDRKEYQETLFALADLYCQGYDLLWSVMFGNMKPKRMNLPTYPFRRGKYWVTNLESEDYDNEDNGIQVIESNLDNVPQEGLKKSFYEKIWTEANKTQIEIPDFNNKLLLVLVNDETYEIADIINKELGTKDVIIVRSSNKYEKLSNNEFCMDFSQAKHGNYFMEDITVKSFACCLDFSDLNNKPGSNVRGCSGKIIILQNLIKSIKDDKLYLFHFTKNLQSFKNKELRLQGSVMAGLIKVLSSEYKKVISRTIDLDFLKLKMDELVKLVVKELGLETPETEICYRDACRYVPKLGEIELDNKQFGFSKLLNPNKVAVITGGTRGIGSEIASYLVQQGILKLVLLGKEKLPPRDTWKSLVQGQGDNLVISKIKKIIELENKGADIKMFYGSLTDKERLEDFFDNIRSTMGQIGGVIHCAGTVDLEDAAFMNKKIKNFENVLEPKVDGLINTCQVLERDNLDYFVLFSSISAVVPTLAVGMSDYSTANSFMNYFAEYQNSISNTKFISINWPIWKEGGLGKITPAYQEYGLAALKKNEGLSLLENAFGFNNTSIMPVLSLKGKFQTNYLMYGRKEVKSNKMKVSMLTPLIKLLSKELKIPLNEMDPDTKFEEFGIDSIILTDLIPKIETLIDAKLDPTVFLENPSLKQLSNYLDSKYELNVYVKEEEQTKKSEIEDVIVEDYSKVTHDETSNNEFRDIASSLFQKVAVIGIACHFPEAEDIDSYWDNLKRGKSSISEVPKSRWNSEEFYSSDHHNGKSISKWGGFIDGIEYFDPDYFNISEEDAIFTDPLTRQFLEVTAQCFRDSGYSEADVYGKNIGVFLGTRIGNYTEKVLRADNKLTGVAIGQNFIAANVSQTFNLKGPNMVVDTACSSSLTAIHLACQSLITKESSIALAGGVDILLDEKPYLLLSDGKALSPDGKCHTFDESANGFVPGEGAGAVLLKNLEQAVKDGDHIYAVIDASAINNDGHTMGITTPNPEAQREVIKTALKRGRISPDTISYIETHGTGTMIGDPIELRALNKVFTEFTQERQFCGVGSVKTNIGHLFSAAGVASFIKVVLALKYGYIPPTLNCERPNPRFEFFTSPFYLVKELKKWEARHGIRRAGISSFGFGGTNAHMIISEAIANVPKGYKPRREHLSHVIFKRRRFWPDNNLKSEESYGYIPKNHKKMKLLELFEETNF